MQKRCCFVFKMLFLVYVSCVLSGCVNFGVQEMSGATFVIHVQKDSNVRFFCKSEKLGISLWREYDEVTDEESLEWVKDNCLANDENFKVFEMPAIISVRDRENVNIDFMILTDDEIFSGDLNIDILETNEHHLNTEYVILETCDGKTLALIFTYFFNRWI